MKNKPLYCNAFVLLLLISAAFTSCSKNNGPVDEEANSSAGENHTFELELINKTDASDVIKYAGELSNEEGSAIYRNRTVAGQTEHSITLVLGELDEVGSIYGNFDLNDNDQPYTALGPYHLEDGGTMTIRPEGMTDYYVAASGSLTFTGLKYALPVSTHGSACFTLTFEGDFEKYIENGQKSGDIYQVSGKIVVSPEDDMGTYRTP